MKTHLSTAEPTGSASTLLGPSDPEVYSIVQPSGARPALLVTDHASNIVPQALDGLGLAPDVMELHIAYDIGAAGVTRRLAERLDIPAVQSGFSRLVIDINRPPEDFTSIREISDGAVIPGNRDLTPFDRLQRAQEIFWPYHNRVEAMMREARLRAGRAGVEAPALISVHSCTDEMRGMKRPWHIGVLYNRDWRMAYAVLEALERQNPELMIGDNKPYSGLDPYGFTVEHHALPARLPNILFEVRQDLIGDAAGQRKFADILARALEEVLADPQQLTFFQRGEID
ncbi:MAG: N-formylglutamate amidohydrolase [Alphaproteobacteria bacterium]|nr:N-formylglutamate amidohydrolase [Alphaproteobacteria bacterium]